MEAKLILFSYHSPPRHLLTPSTVLTPPILASSGVMSICAHHMVWASHPYDTTVSEESILCIKVTLSSVSICKICIFIKGKSSHSKLFEILVSACKSIFIRTVFQ